MEILIDQNKKFDEISKLKQLIFYEKILNKIFNIVEDINNKDQTEEILNPKEKLDCEPTDNYYNIFSEIKTACLINKEEVFPSTMLNIQPNDLKSELGKDLKIQRL